MEHSSQGRGPVHKIVRVVVIGIAGALLVTAWNSFFILPEGVQAVVTQFGRPVGEPVVDAGLHLKTPFVQEVAYFDKKILIWDGDPNQIPTRDKTFVYVDVTARWRIANALVFLQAVNNETRAHDHPGRHHRFHGAGHGQQERSGGDHPQFGLGPRGEGQGDGAMMSRSSSAAISWPI